MYIPTSSSVALKLMIFTMLCWGSWSNTQKLILSWPARSYAALFSVAICITALGLCSIAGNGLTFHIERLIQLSLQQTALILVAGGLCGIAIYLLITVIPTLGLAVSFPINIGLALVIGTSFSYFMSPIGNLSIIIFGMVFILLAIILNAIISIKKSSVSKVTHTKKSLLICCIGGVLLGSFYPTLAKGMLYPSPLDPYTTLLISSIGFLLITQVPYWLSQRRSQKLAIPANTIALKNMLINYLLAIIGGAIWCLGTYFNLIASGQLGPAIAFSLSQGGALVAGLWGVFIWREFKGKKSLYPLIILMFVIYLLGLFLLSFAV